MTAKEILIDELREQGHPEKVEDVIFWALEYYAENRKKGTWGETVAFAIKQRILDAEKRVSESGCKGTCASCYEYGCDDWVRPPVNFYQICDREQVLAGCGPIQVAQNVWDIAPEREEVET